MSELPRLWLNDERQELVRWLMQECYWSSKEVGEAWGELQRELEHLEKLVQDLMDEAERRKYYFARRCYQWRWRLTPNTRMSWPERFKDVYGQSLDEYMQQCQKANTKQQVIEYEHAKFGKSPLDKEDAA